MQIVNTRAPDINFEDEEPKPYYGPFNKGPKQGFNPCRKKRDLGCYFDHHIL
jgi:hypothetical protein